MCYIQMFYIWRIQHIYAPPMRVLYSVLQAQYIQYIYSSDWGAAGKEQHDLNVIRDTSESHSCTHLLVPG